MNLYQTFFTGSAQVGCPECQAHLHQQQQQQHQQHHCLRPPGPYLLPCGHFTVDNNSFDFVNPNQSQNSHSSPGDDSAQLSTLCMANPSDQQHYTSRHSGGDFGLPLHQNHFSPSMYMIATDNNIAQHSVLFVDPAATPYQFLAASLPFGSQPLPSHQLLPTSHPPEYKEISLPNVSSAVSQPSQLPMLTASAPDSSKGSENYCQQFMNSTGSIFPTSGMTAKAMTAAQSSGALIQAEHSVIKAGCVMAQSCDSSSNLPYTHHITTAPEVTEGPPLVAHGAVQTPLDIGMCLSVARASSTIPPLVASHTARTSPGVTQLSPLVSVSSSNDALNIASYTSLHSTVPGLPAYSFAPPTRPTPSAISSAVSAAHSHRLKQSNGSSCSGPSPSRHMPLLSSGTGTYAAPLSRNLNIPASLTAFPIMTLSRGRRPSSSLAPSTSTSSLRSDITFTGNTTPKTFGKRNINSASNGVSYIRQGPDQAQQENHYPFPTTAFSHTQFPRQSSPAPLTSPPTKRLCNSYMLYRKNTFAKNKTYFKQSGSSGAAISREIAQRWNQEPESVKKLFELQAEMERHRVLQAFPDYKYKKRGPQKIKSTNGKIDGGVGAESVTKQNSKNLGVVESKASSNEGVKTVIEGTQKIVLGTPPRIALSIQQRSQLHEGL
ncbi:unnamed protein product [Mortierella alpina]